MVGKALPVANWVKAHLFWCAGLTISLALLKELMREQVKVQSGESEPLGSGSHRYVTSHWAATALTHTHTPTPTHTHTHTHIHTHTLRPHTHTHIHTHTEEERSQASICIYGKISAYK